MEISPVQQVVFNFAKADLLILLGISTILMFSSMCVTLLSSGRIEEVASQKFWGILLVAFFSICLTTTTEFYESEYYRIRYAREGNSLFLAFLGLPAFASGITLGAIPFKKRSILDVRIDADTKQNAMTSLKEIGLTLSQAVRLLLHRIAVDQAFVLELKGPNAQTRAAMAEVDEMVKTREARFGIRRTSKKPTANIRATVPRRVDYARKFLKDWERVSRSGRHDINRLKEMKDVVLFLIASESPLGPERRDRALRGSWTHYRECQVGDDFLLIYRLDDTDGPSGSIYFVRFGTCAELFE